MSRVLTVAGVLLIALARPAAASADERPQVTATAYVPTGAGWTEVGVTVHAGEAPWEGTLGLAGPTAKVGVAVAVPARGQRSVSIPIWLEAGPGSLRLWGPAAEPGPIATPDMDADRTLLVDRQRELPGSWRTLEAFDGVIVSGEAISQLTPRDTAVLDAWLRWGGTVAVVQPDATVRVSQVGRGTAIVAPDMASARSALQRLRVGGPALPDRALATLHEFERAGSTLLPPADPSRPGRSLAAVVVLYATMLGCLGVLAPGVPALRAASAPLTMLLAGGASLAVWGLGGVDGAAVDVRERALLVARPGGEAPFVSALLTVRARRAGTTRWRPLVDFAMVSETQTGRGDPARTVRWNAADGLWARAWAAGESTFLRAAGGWRDLGVRVSPATEGRGWRVKNLGSHTLREASVIAVDGSCRRIGDIPPSASDVEARAPAPGAACADASWRGLIRGGVPGTEAILVATLDPPVTPLQAVEDAADVVRESHLVVPLPSPRRSSR